MRGAALVVAFALGCGARQASPDDPLGGIEDELPGTCVDPRTALASTVVDIRAIDRDSVIVCAGTTVCRKIELETGAMVEPSPSQLGPVTAVAAYGDGGGAAPGPGETAITRLGDVLYTTTSDATGVRGKLYAADGSLISMVGGDDAPIDVRRAVPMQVGVTEWAWLDASGSVLALHDVARRVRARIDLGASGVGVGLSDARATPEGLVVIALGGTRFGDLQLVETNDGVMTTLKARKCEP